MQDIVIEVRAGIVVEVYTDLQDARVVLVDWDEAEHAKSQGRVGTVFPHVGLLSLPDETREQCEHARATAASAEGHSPCV